MTKTESKWDPRRKRLEVTHRGYRLERGVAYQFDLWDGGKVVTCTWAGFVDSDGEPVFETVDFPRHSYVPRSATFFAPLAEVA